MRMKLKRVLVLALAAVMLLGSAAMAAGNLLRDTAPRVVYDGATGEFTLENVTNTDLFPEFKNILPGDVLTQEITLVTKNLTEPVAIYLTSTPDEGSRDALEPITVAVTRSGAELGEFAHSLRENVPVGVFPEDGVNTLQVTLSAPITLDNMPESARTGHIKWDFTAQRADMITITPASISSYVGGVSSNESGAPTLRFHVQLPNGVIWDNDRSITMTLHQEGREPITMTPRKVEGSDSYYCFPTLERGLKFVDGNQYLQGDYLTLTNTFDSGNRGGRYAVGLVSDPGWYITAVGQSGRAYTVQVLPGDAKVYVRYVSSDAEMMDHPSSALTKVVSDETKVNTIVDAGDGVIYRKAVAVIPEDATYYTNGKSSGLGSFTLDQGREDDADGLKPPLVALLFDDTVSLSDDLTDRLIEERMIEHAGHAASCGGAADYSFEGWEYNFRYLDLVNYTDGNAWVSTDAPTTIYWPYPIQALNDPNGYSSYEYQILHYQGLSRSFAHKAIADIDQWEQELLHGPDGAVKVYSEPLELTPRGIRFDLETIEGSEDNFSPFVLMWRKKTTSTPSESYTSVTVKKQWRLDDGAAAPDAVTVALLRDGKEYATAQLSADNAWTHTWRGLSTRYRWKAVEKDVPAGFAATVEKVGTVFTITNDDLPDQSAASPSPSPSGDPAASPSPSDGTGTQPSPAPSDGTGTQPSPAPSDGTGAQLSPAPSDGAGTQPSPAPSDGTGTQPSPVPSDGTGTQPSPAPSDGTGTQPSPVPTDGTGGQAGPSASPGPSQGPTLPQTGQVWWPVFLLAAGGVILLALGLGMGKKEKGKHEA